MGARTVRPRVALSISICLLKYGGPPADGGHPGGRTPRRAADRRALPYTTYGHKCLFYGGREYTGGAPTRRQGRCMYQRQNASTLSALFHFSAQPKKCYVWLANYCEYIMILVINGELGQFALYHQHNGMTCGCLAFAFPAVPHFNSRYLRAAWGRP